LNFFGPNIVVTQDQAWKRHRVVANPAFNEAVYHVVWQETTRALADWFSEVDSNEIPIHTTQFMKVSITQ
ncbi:hypothetical protein K435DRAFT_689724, partial [Dendrothele bispora CBS 962.96]